MKKLVVKLDINGDKAKQKALKAVATLQGIDSIAVDMKEKKLTVIGTVDPVNVVGKLRKHWQTDMISVGPAKEPEKPKAEPKPEGDQQAKKLEAGGGKEQQQQQQEEEDPNKKPEGGGDQEKVKLPGDRHQEEKNNEEEQKQQQPNYKEGREESEEEDDQEDQEKWTADPALEVARTYRAYNNPQSVPNYYYVPSMEENPNACSIC